MTSAPVWQSPPTFYNSTSVSVLVVSYVLLASLHLNWAEGSTP